MEFNKQYNVIIIGGGAAGLAAATYLKRANMSVAIFESNVLGGQMMDATVIENYPGHEAVMGSDLADDFVQTMENTSGIIEPEIIYSEVMQVLSNNNRPIVIDADGISYICDYCIITTGLKHRELEVEGAKDLFARGKISYCATCDGAFFAGQDVVVVGGGNSAAQYALMLSQICANVYMLDIGNFDYMDATSADAIYTTSNILRIAETPIKKLQEFNDKILINDKLLVDGIFVAMGREPASDFISVKYKDDKGYIITNDSGKVTGHIYAAGDCVSGHQFHQVVLAAAEGTQVALNIIKDDARIK